MTEGLLRSIESRAARTREALERMDLVAVLRLVERLYAAYESGSRVFVFGNGGSAAAASHFAEDLSKGALPEFPSEKRLRAHSLADPMPFLTALANDCGYESVFREQLATHASAGDLAIAISGSGSSPNVLAAIRWAKEHGLFTCGMTGFDGGRLRELVDLSIHAPVDDMEIAENFHMVAMHLAVAGLRERIRAARVTEAPEGPRGCARRPGAGPRP
ncbi:MAG: SIS domain-containing protein [Planctomycetota bacterium]